MKSSMVVLIAICIPRVPPGCICLTSRSLRHTSMCPSIGRMTIAEAYLRVSNYYPWNNSIASLKKQI